jgi:hypothetical protein
VTFSSHYHNTSLKQEMDSGNHRHFFLTLVEVFLSEQSRRGTTHLSGIHVYSLANLLLGNTIIKRPLQKRPHTPHHWSYCKIWTYHSQGIEAVVTHFVIRLALSRVKEARNGGLPGLIL